MAIKMIVTCCALGIIASCSHNSIHCDGDNISKEESVVFLYGKAKVLKVDTSRWVDSLGAEVIGAGDCSIVIRYLEPQHYFGAEAVVRMRDSSNLMFCGKLLSVGDVISFYTTEDVLEGNVYPNWIFCYRCELVSPSEPTQANHGQ